MQVNVFFGAPGGALDAPQANTRSSPHLVMAERSESQYFEAGLSRPCVSPSACPPPALKNSAETHEGATSGVVNSPLF